MQQQELRNKLASYKLPFESLVFCDAIGTGGFGKVYEGTCNGQICAIKEIKYGDSPNADQIYQEFLNESYLMVTLYHYNIVDFMVCNTQKR
jgi:serine/threonine protein kinase